MKTASPPEHKNCGNCRYWCKVTTPYRKEAECGNPFSARCTDYTEELNCCNVHMLCTLKTVDAYISNSLPIPDEYKRDEVLHVLEKRPNWDKPKLGVPKEFETYIANLWTAPKKE